jgi:hypothetical protein
MTIAVSSYTKAANGFQNLLISSKPRAGKWPGNGRQMFSPKTQWKTFLGHWQHKTGD